MIIQNSTDIKTELFYDENGDIKSVDVQYEKHTINPNGLIQLQKIPTIHSVFDIKGQSGVNLVRYNKADVILNQTDFTVDYQNGILTFHSSQKGKEVEISYTNAIGRLMISADRIFTSTDNQGNVVKTVQKVIDDGNVALSGLDTLGGAVKVIQQTQANIDAVKGLTGSIIDGNNIKTSLDKSNTTARTTDTVLKSTVANANDKIQEMTEWVNQNGDVVNLNNRVTNTESKLNTVNTQLEDIVVKKEENIYVNLNGNDENNGLSTSTSFKTIKRAFEYVRDDVKSSLVKKYVVNIGSGVYNELDVVFDTPTVERVTIKGADVGGHPNVPTTIINGEGGTSYAHGIRINGVGVKVLVKDIKFINFKGNNTRIGLVGENESDLTTDNIHADGCDWCGIYAFNTVRARIQGGILTNCRSGFIANSTQCTIGYTEGKGTTISSCIESGIYWSRGSQGHIDYVSISNCGIGIDISENSRVDTIKNTLAGNTIGIRTRNGGVYGEGGEPNIFNNNTTNIAYKALSGDTTELTNSTNDILVAYERLLKNATGQGTFELNRPYTLKAKRLQGVGKYLKIDIYGVGTMSSGSALIVAIGGMTVSLTVPSALTSSVIKATVELFEVGGGYRAFGSLQGNLTNSRLATSTTGFNSEINNDIVISTTLTNSSDSLNIYRVNVFING